MAVRFQRKTGKWEAKIVFLGEEYHIGSFNTEQEANDRFEEIKKARERIKRDMKAEKDYPLAGNDFAVSAYERGQEVKQICIDCKGGQQGEVRLCTNSGCEFYKLRPI